MRFLDLTLPTLAENLAIDEALLKCADEIGGLSDEVLRVWQATELGIVVGRSGRVDDEVHLELAGQRSIPVLRRPSGGATVVVGPGCLLYSLLLDLKQHPELKMLDVVHARVMRSLIQALEILAPQVLFDGTCDLVVGDRKFSGNCLKVGRHWTLYHGTILLSMDLFQIEQLLKHPPREPAYRRGRPHDQFVTNLGLPVEAVTAALRQAFAADQPITSRQQELLRQQSEELLQQKYLQSSWNLQR